ncbi:activin receptor type-2B-like [Octopus sinensis]|uniref:receptor protein serine/threonine kinase n=1 Tax=Octopus sinensis TaxID=2607531 RepID=A0A6P7TQ59_9MOLL|nr:activin receptor type-2B-like [Octopus sinensis]
MGDVWKSVFRGSYKGTEIVLKVAPSSHILRELAVFDILSKYEGYLSSNIAKLLSVVSVSDSNWRFGLIGEYYPQGSLYDLLKDGRTMLQVDELCHLVESVVLGLVFLHELRPNKPAIAHRNFKSSKILVGRSEKGQLRAFLSDMSSALVFNGCEDSRSRSKVGDCRYMAPELLEGLVDVDYSAYLAIDMYAFSLVLWEVLSTAGLVFVYLSRTCVFSTIREL